LNANTRKTLSIILSVLCCFFFGWVLLIYAIPMESISLDLSLMAMGGATTEEITDTKGWTVYTQEGDQIKELEPTGRGPYRGLELGQTVYLSRLMTEKLDSPTLQIGTADRTFSVFLDDTLIYTDHPDMDNKIGYLQLPMNGPYRNDPIIISLPPNYLGKTLTIAQATPPYTEGSLAFYPASVKLYCGYSYESGLIAESFQTAALAILLFAVGVILLVSFVFHQDMGTLSMALISFLWMVSTLTNTSFFFSYSGHRILDIPDICRSLTTLALMAFFISRTETHRRIPLILLILYVASLLVSTAGRIICPNTIVPSQIFLFHALPEWIAMIGLCSVLVLSVIYWHRESRFYRLFLPVCLVLIILYWIYSAITTPYPMLESIVVSLQSYQITYIYYHCLPPIIWAAIAIALEETFVSSRNRILEKRLLQERHELTLANYKNIQRQHEEVMMIRHDMMGHIKMLHNICSQADTDTVALHSVRTYLNELMGQHAAIRPVVQTGNEMLDILLGSKVNAAREKNIQVEIQRASAPAALPIPDADLCSLMMNILDNAIQGAVDSGAVAPMIHLDLHEKNGYLVFVCKNSADPSKVNRRWESDSLPQHGLGLKIIANITQKYNGIIDKTIENNSYQIRIAFPIH